MKYLPLLGALAIFLSSCSTDPIPENILPQKKMAAIYIDMHMAEQILAEQNMAYDSAKAYFLDTYKPKVLKLHNVEAAQFDSSHSFYEKKPELMAEIYHMGVIDTLSVYESKKKVKPSLLQLAEEKK